MPSVTVSEIVTDPGGRVRVRFGKDVREFASIQALRDYARSNLTRADLIDIALGLMLFRQPGLANPASLVGHSVSVDFSLASWGTIT